MVNSSLNLNKQIGTGIFDLLFAKMKKLDLIMLINVQN